MEQILTQEELESFRNALHIIPQWSKAVPVTVNYLRQLVTPIKKLRLQYTMVNPTTTNHYLVNCTYPKLNPFAVGTNVMLMKEYVVERGLMNGSVGFSTRLFIPYPMDLHHPIPYPHMSLWYFQTV